MQDKAVGIKVKDRDRINQELSMYRGNIERNESEIDSEVQEINNQIINDSDISNIELELSGFAKEQFKFI